MKKIIYTASIILALGFYGCNEVKEDATEIEEGFKAAEKDLEDHPIEKVEEGFKDAEQDLESDVKEIKDDVKEEVKEIKEEVKEVTHKDKK